MKRWALCALMLAAIAPAAGSQSDSLDALSTETLLARAGDYTRRFEQSMATVVLEERYVQLVKVWGEPPIRRTSRACCGSRTSRRCVRTSS